MVKSFKGVESHDEHRNPIKLVRDYMTVNVVSLKADESMEHAMRTLMKYQISGAPVVDAQGTLVGVLSEGDCLKEIVKGRYSGLPNDTGLVKEHMTQEVATMEADTSIIDAAQTFLNMRFRRFPVLENGRLIGLLTQSDIIKAVNDL